MEYKNYKCAKCESQEFDSGQLRAAGGFWTKLFNIQNLTFVTLSCKKCGY
ncbi:MAG: putative nucleic-acid-binding Zn-ribbon protein, partial [Candidatus Paceibacteria bacterium]